MSETPRYRAMRLSLAVFCAASWLGVTAATRAATPTFDPDSQVVPMPEAPKMRDPLGAIKELLRAERSIVDAAQGLDIAIARRGAQLEQLKAQLEVVKRDLRQTTRRFEDKTRALEAARQLVRLRLRAIAQHTRIRPYHALFGAGSYSDLLRRKRVLKRLVDSDRARALVYRGQLAGWRKARTDLERRQANLEATQLTIRYLLQQLEWDRQEKEALLVAVRDKASFYSKAMREVEGIDKELRERVLALRDAELPRLWFAENKGRLVNSPIRGGTIIEKFGRRKNKRFGVTTFNAGIDIVPKSWDPQEDVPVLTIYAGTVAYAGWLRGLGNAVIVDHTRGYMSVYGHLERIDVRPGERLKNGQTIGIMGHSGSLKGRRLHLQLRENGNAIDPAPWIQ